MITLSVEGLTKSYGSSRKAGRLRKKDQGPQPRVFAVSDVSFEVKPGELFTLLGPSGCGKTTTLRSIAGLERPDDGKISLERQDLFDAERKVNLPPNQRGLGMVFQSYAIWPHLSVFNNVAFPLQVLPRARRPKKAEIDEVVRRSLETTELGLYADRPATALSGGQQQRLALARAMVMQPRLMLLDEPLSNLDAKLRGSMRIELKRLQREFGLTSIYVTHDQVEALMLSTRIAVMNQGKIEQIGNPREIYLHPATKFVAEFIGTANMFEGVVTESSAGMTRIDTANGTVWSRSQTAMAAKSTVLLSVRPECITISTQSVEGAAPNEWQGVVAAGLFLGDSAEHVISVGDQEIRVKGEAHELVSRGTKVYLRFAPENVTVIPSTAP